MFIRSLPEINHILNEMYQVDPKVETYYLKLKILELLLLIRMVTPEEEKAQKRYYRQQDYDKVRAIHKEVVSHPDRRFSVPQLVQKYTPGMIGWNTMELFSPFSSFLDRIVIDGALARSNPLLCNSSMIFISFSPL